MNMKQVGQVLRNSVAPATYAVEIRVHKDWSAQKGDRVDSEFEKLTEWKIFSNKTLLLLFILDIV